MTKNIHSKKLKLLPTSTSYNDNVPSSSPTAIALPSGRQHKDDTHLPAWKQNNNALLTLMKTFVKKIKLYTSRVYYIFVNE
jgi:hypothetical protein